MSVDTLKNIKPDQLLNSVETMIVPKNIEKRYTQLNSSHISLKRNRQKSKARDSKALRNQSTCFNGNILDVRRMSLMDPEIQQNQQDQSEKQILTFKTKRVQQLDAEEAGTSHIYPQIKCVEPIEIASLEDNGQVQAESVYVPAESQNTERDEEMKDVGKATKYFPKSHNNKEVIKGSIIEKDTTLTPDDNDDDDVLSLYASDIELVFLFNPFPFLFCTEQHILLQSG